MAAAISATISDGPICIQNAQAIQKSYPTFFATLLA
jgi:5-enolpyruvylshikimate-3-phosphate synthase